MKTNQLDNRKSNTSNRDEAVAALDSLIELLDHSHPHQRKIQFLLDIRGYLKINRISGNYVEFGSYRSEMQYSAFRIFEELGLIQKYIGLDTFSGEPPLTQMDEEANFHEKERDFLSDYEETSNFVQRRMGKKGCLIKGNFQSAEIREAIIQSGPIAVSVVDCNLLSSIQSAVRLTLETIRPGGVLFIDDYFANFSKGYPASKEVLEKEIVEKGLELLDFNSYPPFAKAFIVY